MAAAAEPRPHILPPWRGFSNSMAAKAEKDYFVYILRCADGTLYTGITNDIKARLSAHNSGKGAKYTRGRLPVELVYTEPCPDKSAALRRELQIKAMKTSAKQSCIMSRHDADQDTENPSVNSVIMK